MTLDLCSKKLLKIKMYSCKFLSLQLILKSLNKMDNKKEIANDYLKNFEELSCYSKTQLFKILGPFIVGLELTPSPYLGESFKPHFVCYSLAENNIKECLDLPLLLRPIYNKKNISLNSIPYKIDSDKYKESIDSIRKLYGYFLFGDVSLKNVNLFDKINSFFKNGKILPMDEAKINLFRYNIALYLDDNHLIERSLNEIHKKREIGRQFSMLGNMEV